MSPCSVASSISWSACRGVALVGEAAQFVDVAALGGKLDQLVGCRGVALVGEASQLVEVAALGSKLDQLINRIPIAVLGTFPQDG